MFESVRLQLEPKQHVGVRRHRPEVVGEKDFQAIDIFPQSNLSGKYLIAEGVGLCVGAGLAFGLLLVGLFEVPRLLTVQTSEDAAHYTGLPVLVAVPELLTAQEAQVIPRRRRLILAVAVAAMVLAIPALALILKLTQVFERFAV